jgi:hypothetical protein
MQTYKYEDSSSTYNSHYNNSHMLKDMYDSTDSSSLSSSDDSVSDSEALSSFPLASSSLELASPLSSYENKN